MLKLITEQDKLKRKRDDRKGEAENDEEEFNRLRSFHSRSCVLRESIFFARK